MKCVSIFWNLNLLHTQLFKQPCLVIIAAVLQLQCFSVDYFSVRQFRKFNTSQILQKSCSKVVFALVTLPQIILNVFLEFRLLVCVKAFKRSTVYCICFPLGRPGFFLSKLSKY